MSGSIANPGEIFCVPSYQSCIYVTKSLGVSLLAFFYAFASARNTKSPVPILAARYAVQVEDQFETVITGPRHSLAEVRELPLDIRFAWSDFPGPITDRQPHVV